MTEIPIEGAVPAAARPGILGRLCRAAVFASMRGVRYGSLRFVEGERERVFGGSDGPRATVRVRDPRFWADVALGGSVGAGESYVDGRWTCDDLVSLVRIVAGNAEANQGLERRLARLRAPAERLLHALRRNTRAGSRRNIAAHYDLGNEFYRLFLDPTLMYSSAVFPRDEASLEEASHHKNDLVCRKLDLRPDDSLLEIGTGWGGFAIHAAGRYGCTVVTTTVSAEQHRLATERIRDAGLDGRVTVLLEDYRDLPRKLGRRFGKLVSIEMVEAVGHRYLDAYLGVCSRLLEPHGTMVLQSIVMADRHHDAYLRSVDFIRKHVFPGGCLPSVASLTRSMARATDLRLVGLEDITAHYARTLALWRRRFHEALPSVRALGFDDRFVRLWDYYLAYCEGAFRERVTGNVQLVFSKPRRDVGAPA